MIYHHAHGIAVRQNPWQRSGVLPSSTFYLLPPSPFAYFFVFSSHVLFPSLHLHCSVDVKFIFRLCRRRGCGFSCVLDMKLLFLVMRQIEYTNLIYRVVSSSY